MHLVRDVNDFPKRPSGLQMHTFSHDVSSRRIPCLSRGIQHLPLLAGYPILQHYVVSRTCSFSLPSFCSLEATALFPPPSATDSSLDMLLKLSSRVLAWVASSLYKERMATPRIGASSLHMHMHRGAQQTPPCAQIYLSRNTTLPSSSMSACRVLPAWGSRHATVGRQLDTHAGQSGRAKREQAEDTNAGWTTVSSF